MPKTYNQYVSEGVQDGTIKEFIIDGCRAYIVRAPLDGEEVVGYSPSSSVGTKETITERAEREGRANS